LLGNFYVYECQASWAMNEQNGMWAIALTGLLEFVVKLASEWHRMPHRQYSIVFDGRRGSLEMELWGSDRAFCGAVSPAFYSRSGETLAVPDEFQDAVARISAAVCCIGCRHCHLLQPKALLGSSDEAVGTAAISGGAA
jgi:hypothetical protein